MAKKFYDVLKSFSGKRFSYAKCDRVELEEETAAEYVEDGFLSEEKTGGGSSDEIIAQIMNQGLSEVVIPKGINTIRAHVFYNWWNLKTVTALDDIWEIGEYAFYYCSNLESLPNFPSVGTVYQYAFYGCSGLKDVQFGESLVTIGKNAFDGSGIMKLDIKNATNFRTVDANAFCNCSNLETVILPAKTKTIGNLAFANCPNLKTITIYASTPPALGTTSLNNTGSLETIYIPSGSLAAYSAATNWSKQSSKFVEMEA